MYNFGKIIDVIVEELGGFGAQAVCEAVSFYLWEGKEEFSCAEDKYVLTVMLMAMDERGLNCVQREYDPLMHLE